MPGPSSVISNLPTFRLVSGQLVKLGRIRPKARPVGLQLKRYVKEARARPLPPSVDFLSKSVASIKQMYGNDEEGDCVVASFFHGAGIWSGNDNKQVIVGTREEALSEYHRIGGPQDNGLVITDLLNDAKRGGIMIGGKRRKIDGWVAVDNRDKMEVMTAIVIFGGGNIGFNVPAEYMNTPDGGTWDLPSRFQFVGGHDVRIIDFHVDRGVRVATWAGTRWFTWRAFMDQRIVDEAYVQLSPDWYNDDMLSPYGLDVATLRADLDKIDDPVLPPWEPEPGPGPGPQVCPAGQHWDAALGKCVPDGPGPSPGPLPAESRAYVFRDQINGTVVNLNATFPANSTTATVTAVSVVRKPAAGPNAIEEAMVQVQEAFEALQAAIGANPQLAFEMVEGPYGKINPMTIFFDLMMLLMAYQAKDFYGMITAGWKLLTDLGVPMPPLPTPPVPAIAA